MKAGEAYMNNPKNNDLKVVITKSEKNPALEDLSKIGQRSVHEGGHSAGLDHSWEKNSGVPLDKASQESNALNSGQQESVYPVSNGSNMTITQQQIHKIFNNPKIPEKNE
ncbi:hypothetical protein ODZ84_01835 [Chryseobacterium fluminis]|uniref:hypothetical protein n=1 Tax=Chryseobacterium fluminis TaxID=2983606 RepID=UPI0022577CE1|nr:hypothetical protein [Chryseobacterium sp. MMS21-Ot14]UZT98335.1 hypothetical protein ODZ84_01835 [Chryseobacterium sp. MMS21-Ot14]